MVGVPGKSAGTCKWERERRGFMNKLTFKSFKMPQNWASSLLTAAHYLNFSNTGHQDNYIMFII